MHFSPRPQPSPGKTSSEDCVVTIMQMIREGRISATDRVGEASLASLLGVGLSAAREALKRLSEAGILVRISRTGSFVRKFTLQDFVQIMDVRCALECLAIRQATLTCSESALDELRQEALKVDEIAVNPYLQNKYDHNEPSSFERDRDFHLQVCRLSKNEWLLSILKNQHLLERCFLMELQFQGLGEAAKKIPSHVEIVEAMVTRNIDTAEDAIQRHILMHKEIRVRSLMGELVEA